MTITRAMAMVLLEPKLSQIWNEPFPQRPLEYIRYMNIRQANKATITDFKMTDFGPFTKKAEGEQIVYTDPIFGSTKTFTPIRFAQGYKITQEMIDHELYGQTDRLESAMLKGAVDGQETIAAQLMNGAFGTTDTDGYSSTGFDGLQLCSTSHPRLDGGTAQANRPATDVDLGVTALQNAVIAYENLKDDRGRPALIRPRTLIISPEDKFTARELIDSEYKPGTANNEINALQDENLTFMVSHYKTDTDAWFLFGDTTGLQFLWDVKPRQDMMEDFDAEVIKRKVVEGFFCGHGEFRGAWATSGG